jgi:putative ABC transport system substrate-binding protein
MRRREFLSAVGGAAVWPLAVHAQQPDVIRRIGILLGFSETDREGQARVAAFLQALRELGWSNKHVKIDIRWFTGNASDTRRHATELVTLAPDVILSSGGPTLRPLLEATRTVPVVFVQVSDPVGSGFVDSLSRPGRNATGFTQFEFGLSAKWLELLKQIAPQVRQAAVLRDPSQAAGLGQWGAIQSVAPSVGVELRPIDVRAVGELERAVTAFAQVANGGLIVTPSPPTFRHRELIITLAAQHNLPTIYPYRFFVTSGGLAAYGPNTLDPYRRAAGYVDRILRGEKPADLPVQAPTKYELVINLKTAKALGLTIPPLLLARADEVIE